MVSNIDQAVIAEAEPRRGRFPNLACGRLSRSPASRSPFQGALPPAVRSGEEHSAGDTALGFV
jgi:hypothetical protein